VQQVAGCRIDADYPAPIIDHAVAVREAKRRLATARGHATAREEAREVARRHGSRKDRRGAMQQDPIRRQLRKPPAGGRPASRSIPDLQRRLPFGEDEPTG
jgi:hypothetical protein